MTCETSREEDLAMMSVNLGGGAGVPFNTHFLLSLTDKMNGEKCCPRFYGKTLDKLKVYDALTKDIHPEVKSQWGELKCHCSRIPILRLSKTARNLNRVFLVCGTPPSAGTRCKYFQWIHSALFIDNRPLHKLMYATKQSRAESKLQGTSDKQDTQTQTDCVNPMVEAAQIFAESAKKQEQQRKAQIQSNPLPSTFQSSPEIAKELKKQEQWKEVMSIANHRFNSALKGFHHLPQADAAVAEYLTKRKSEGYVLSPPDEKFLKQANKLGEWKPSFGAEQYEKNEAAIARAVQENWSFGYLPEKVCSLMSYCRKRKKEGLPLTPVEERFFAQLVNVYEETAEQKQEREKRFVQECDANNAERRKRGLLPYSYETFRTFGTGIF